MRTIDADALKELFSEVIGRIAKKPEMNGNLEHMIRASAMVIQMIEEAPTVQPDTTTHDSIPAETGKNDGDRTSGDCISRQAVTKFLNDWLSCLFENCHKQSASDLKMIIKDFKNLPSAQSELEDKIREIGYTGKEGRIYIGGRLFAVRELPQ